ncbi:hypothetical protein SU69_07935 [Thermosipho melanesiensis]|uniref:FG-GAP repeat protein n=2 Tax=Thermosipho melanesiensis TaxID=46541 RepID=A6LNA7_THEM4|nr:hypothetical protein [Thermosipho melanesiensis]ABR31408.1 hypothetical protein Tmel_1563 [Thermosipho melanesiensis BI429]APT74467.1 hypothetical protein BW47_08290 [Thermosipho melanesiensis]OOC36427.1 hypothetical protein SU68_08005 [Thermosipho melanesiensis]OOC37245.1 hypothetical protein SU69_07935 [Thermosipho melanesiensis]OOC37997.1 hypothetical protein SU70_07945 [Thermosipho melanesiensis]
MKNIIILFILLPILSLTEIIQTTSIDINNDNKPETIILEGTPISSIYWDDLFISLKTTELIKKIKLGFGGYNPELFVLDFDGDKTLDIFIKADSGGSGNFNEYFIYSLTKGIILNNEELVNLSGFFMDGFKAIIKYKEFYTYIDLSDKKEFYIQNKIYNKYGQFIGKDKRLFIGGISNLKTIDFQNDKTYELEGYISISGAFHADKIGFAHFIYSVKKKKVIWLEISKLIYIDGD